jgi:hypothetical protein
MIDQVLIGTSSVGSRSTSRHTHKIFKVCFKRGMRRIDCAPVYGMGQAPEIISKIINKENIDNIKITTKLGLDLKKRKTFLNKISPYIYILFGSKGINFLRKFKNGENINKNTFNKYFINEGLLEDELYEFFVKFPANAVDNIIFHDINISDENIGKYITLIKKIKNHYPQCNVGFSSNEMLSYQFSKYFDCVNIDYLLLQKVKFDNPKKVYVYSIFYGSKKLKLDPILETLKLLEKNYNCIINPFGKRGYNTFRKILEKLV